MGSFLAVLFRAYRRKPARLGWPQAEVREAEIHIASYPFSHSSLFPGPATVPASRITALFQSITDAALVLDGNEVIFLPREHRNELQAFAERHHVPAPNIMEVWSALAEPYLDTEYTADQEARDFVRLAEQGYGEAEVRELRRRISGPMLTATWFTWEWGLHTTQDVLRAFATLSPRKFTPELYSTVMEVALRPYRAVDPDAPRRLAALKPHWQSAWSDLGASPRAGLFGEVAGRYLETHRAYHTLRHLEECFTLFAAARPLCAHPGEVAFALWLHDAVYQPKTRESEEASARWARKILSDAGAPADVAARVQELILATQHAASPPAGDARVLVDIDLAILGAEPARFDEYETQVRKEYAHVPDELFRAGRAKLLHEFLGRPFLYSTPHFRERFEARARANLQRSLQALTAARG